MQYLSQFALFPLPLLPDTSAVNEVFKLHPSHINQHLREGGREGEGRGEGGREGGRERWEGGKEAGREGEMGRREGKSRLMVEEAGNDVHV